MKNKSARRLKRVKDFSGGVKEDIRLLMDGVAEKGKKVMPDEIPDVKMKERITACLKAIIGKTGISTRKDMEKLGILHLSVYTFGTYA